MLPSQKKPSIISFKETLILPSFHKFTEKKEIEQFIEIFKIFHEKEIIHITSNDRSISFGIKNEVFKEKSTLIEKIIPETNNLIRDKNKEEKEKILRTGIILLLDIFRSYLYNIKENLDDKLSELIDDSLKPYLISKIKKDDELKSILYEAFSEDINIILFKNHKVIPDLGKVKYFEITINYGSTNNRKTKTYHITKKQLLKLRDQISLVLENIPDE